MRATFDLPFRDGVITWREAQALGMTAAGVTGAVRRGELWRPVVGTLALGVEPAAWWEAHLVRARAACLRWGEGHLAGESALLAHGLPVLGRPDAVHLGCPGLHRARRRSGVHLHPARGPVVDVPLSGCITRWPAQGVAGAITLLATRWGTTLDEVVVPLDAARRAGKVSSGELRDGIDAGRPGARLLRQALSWADPRSESPGETCVRTALRRMGLHPEPQVEIVTGHGVARVDLLLEELGVVVEFDGAVKYEGADGRQALVREKRREDGLRALGYGVVRVTWADLRPPDADERLRARVLSASRGAGLTRW